MKIGITVGDLGGTASGIDEVVKQVQRAEQAGFASVWFANIFGPDALTIAAVCGRATQRIEIGTSVVPTYTRHPFAMAQQAATTHAAIGARLALGIGLSHQAVIEGMLGLSYAKSYSHMREYLAVLAPLLREGKVKHQGELFRVQAALTVQGSKPCPILVAALAPKMLALAGSVADGTITWMTGPKTLAEHTVPGIRAAASAAGRPAPRIVAGFPIAVTDKVDAARKTVASTLQVYGQLPSYRAMLDREGGSGVGPADIAIVGNAQAVKDQLGKLAAAGVTDLWAVPVPVATDDDAPARTFELLSELAK